MYEYFCLYDIGTKKGHNCVFLCFQEGESWPSPDGDPCKNLTCTRGTDGQLRKEENTQVCNTECALVRIACI
jgi:hypothetical protein